MKFARSFDRVGYRMDILLILSNQPSLTIDKKAGLAIANPAFFIYCALRHLINFWIYSITRRQDVV